MSEDDGSEPRDGTDTDSGHENCADCAAMDEELAQGNGLHNVMFNDDGSPAAVALLQPEVDEFGNETGEQAINVVVHTTMDGWEEVYDENNEVIGYRPPDSVTMNNDDSPDEVLPGSVNLDGFGDLEAVSGFNAQHLGAIHSYGDFFTDVLGVNTHYYVQVMMDGEPTLFIYDDDGILRPAELTSDELPVSVNIAGGDLDSASGRASFPNANSVPSTLVMDTGSSLQGFENDAGLFRWGRTLGHEWGHVLGIRHSINQNEALGTMMYYHDAQGGNGERVENIGIDAQRSQIAYAGSTDLHQLMFLGEAFAEYQGVEYTYDLSFAENDQETGTDNPAHEGDDIHVLGSIFTEQQDAAAEAERLIEEYSLQERLATGENITALLWDLQQGLDETVNRTIIDVSGDDTLQGGQENDILSGAEDGFSTYTVDEATAAQNEGVEVGEDILYGNAGGPIEHLDGQGGDDVLHAFASTRSIDGGEDFDIGVINELPAAGDTLTIRNVEGLVFMYGVLPDPSLVTYAPDANGNMVIHIEGYGEIILEGAGNDPSLIPIIREYTPTVPNSVEDPLLSNTFVTAHATTTEMFNRIETEIMVESNGEESEREEVFYAVSGVLNVEDIFEEIPRRVDDTDNVSIELNTRNVESLVIPEGYEIVDGTLNEQNDTGRVGPVHNSEIVIENAEGQHITVYVSGVNPIEILTEAPPVIQPVLSELESENPDRYGNTLLFNLQIGNVYERLFDILSMGANIHSGELSDDNLGSMGSSGVTPPTLEDLENAINGKLEDGGLLPEEMLQWELLLQSVKVRELLQLQLDGIEGFGVASEELAQIVAAVSVGTIEEVPETNLGNTAPPVTDSPGQGATRGPSFME